MVAASDICDGKATSITLFSGVAQNHMQEILWSSALLLPLLYISRRKKVPFFFGFRIFYKTAVLSYCLSSLSSPGSRRGSPWHNDPLQTGSGTPFPLSLARGEVSLELGCSNGSRSHSRRGPRCYAVLGSKYIHSFSCVSNLWTS